MEEDKKDTEKKKVPMTEEERMELAAKLDNELEEYVKNLERRQYTEGWPEDNWQEEMEKHPFFMTKSPKEGEELSPLLQGIQQLKYDETENTPEELAAAYKEDGVFYFKCKKYRMAVMSFTEGLMKRCKDSVLNAQLCNNRAAAHYFLRNYRSSLSDCKAALALQFPYPKVQYRAAQCYLRVCQDDKCIEYCDELLEANFMTKEALELRATAVNAKKMRVKNARKRSLVRRKTEAEERELMQVVNERGIRVKEKDGTALSLYALESRSLDDNYSGVHLLDGRLVWPVVLMYPEHRTSDFIQAFHEDCTILSQLTTVFETRPMWDIDHKYDVEKLHVYFEDMRDRFVLVDPGLTLGEVMCNPLYLLRWGSPTLFVFVAGTEVERRFAPA